jgi:hypothetical protein
VPHLIHEDVIWTSQALLAANRVRYTGHKAVHYRMPIPSFGAGQGQNRLQGIVGNSGLCKKLAEMSAALYIAMENCAD